MTEDYNNIPDGVGDIIVNMLGWRMNKENDKGVRLDDRLHAAASFVHGGSVADIGTDHALLPISLLLSGKCSSAIASDINEGPLMRAKLNAAKYGLNDRMVFCLADGLEKLPLEERGVSDIVICGMGGELIATIISASDYPKKSGVRLVLQPMTHSADLRRYLAESGFRTVDESLSEDDGRIYECIAAEYDGEMREISPAEAELGKVNIARGTENPLFEAHLVSSYTVLVRRIEGMKKGGLAVDFEANLAMEYKKIAERCGIRL